MYKEIIMIVGIAFFIIGLNCITQKYTKQTIDILSENLEQLKNACNDEKKEKIEYKQKEIVEVWNKRKYWLAYYIEHDELEKIETKISLIEGNIESEEYSEIIADIEDTKFILKHIQEKYRFISQNIF